MRVNTCAMKHYIIPLLKKRASIFLLIIIAGISAKAQAPTIISFNPASGPVGTIVTITGTNFSTVPANNTVYFGAVKASVSAATATSLTVTVPISATFHPITVTVNSLTAIAKKPFIVKFGNGLASFTANSFAPYISFPSLGNPLGLVICDFNNDGKPDMASIGLGILGVIVYRNTSTPGNVSFAGWESIGNTGWDPRAIAVADMDGDGRKEIIIGNGTDGNIFIFKNTSTSGILSFDPTALSFPAFAFCSSIAIGDLNNDGKSDVVMTTNYDTNVAVLKNTSSAGTISFDNVINFSAGPTSYRLKDILIKDFNNDGKPEMAIVDNNAPNSSVYVFRNTSIAAGSINFATPVIFPANGILSDDHNDKLVGEDIDADDKPDITLSNHSTSTLSVLRNTSSGTTISFAAKVDLTAASTPVDLNLTDLDGDGKTDISVANYINNSVTVFKNNSVSGTVSFLTGVDYTTDPDIYSVSVANADFDGDGKPDIAFVNQSGDYIGVLRNNIQSLVFNSFLPTSGPEGTVVTIRGSSFSSVSNVSFGGINASSFTIVSDTTITAVVGKGNSGLVTLTSSGGSTASLAGFTFTGPFIRTFTPTSGSAGSVITLKGINFTNTSAVAFGGTPTASFTVINDTTLTATIGNGSPGDITLVTPVGTAVKSGFNFIQAPLITSFTPTSAGVATKVTIKGKYFTGATAVKLGTIAASSFTVVSDTVITAITAVTTSGTVSVTSPLGTGTLAGFVYLALPSITSFSPLSAAAGSSIIISGFNFSSIAANNIVHFGAVKGTVTAASATSLTITVPTGAKYTRISVTVSSLTAYSPMPFTLSFGGSWPLTTKSFTQKINKILKAPRIDNLLIQDFDGDGKPDVISADDSLIVLRNTGSINNISFSTDVAIAVSGLYTIKPNTADFDGDGKPDIALITKEAFNDVRLTILKNTSLLGNISFIKFDYPVNQLAANLAAVDIDKDGKPDIMINNAGGGYQTYVFRNTTINGNISFSGPLQYTFGMANSDYNISAADLDSDGKVDFITTNGGNDALLLLRNTSIPGNISFAPVVQLNVGGYPTYTGISDIDGDGKSDIVVRNQAFNNSFSVFKNASTAGSFSFPTRTNYGYSSYSGLRFSIADLDGDGKPDIASLNSVDDNTVSIFKNTSTPGNVSMAPPVNNWSEFNMVDIDICDLDGDGRPDIGLMDKTFTVLRNNIKEPVIFSFSPLKAPAGVTVTIKGFSFSGTTAVKFNGIAASSFSIISDTIITAVTPVALAGNVSVTNASGTGQLNQNFPIPQIMTIIPGSAAAGTIVTIKGRNFNPASNQNAVYFGSVKAAVSGGTDSTLIVRVPKGSVSQRLSVTVHRMTAYSPNPFIITFLRGDTIFTANSFEAPVNFATYANPASLVIHDLNGDGKPELAVGEYYFSTILKNASDSGSLLFTPVHDSSSQYEYPLGDIDGDGKFDKVVAQGGPPAVTVGVYRNRSLNDSIFFGRGMQVVNADPFVRSYYFSRPAIDDMNRDGKPDIIAGNNADGSNNGTILILQNNSADRDSVIALIRKTGFVTATTANLVRTADLDGDSIPDVVTLHNNPGISFSVLRNTGNTGNISLANYQSFTGPASASYYEIGDIDGDGKQDIAIISANSKTLSLYRNTSTTGSISFALPVTYSISNTPLSLAIGDLNGDGKQDLAITTSSDSLSVYRNMSVPGIFSVAPKVNYKTGVSPKFVAIGDLDMDGVPDIAVVNSTSRTVSIFRNLQGQALRTPLCNPVGATILQAGITGSTFQWQLSTDSVIFNNIPNNTYYSGVTTSTLNLMNIPSAWYGYQYRCLVNSVSGPVTTLQFINTWTGAVSSAWVNPLNWSCGTVPDINTDVYINSDTVVLNASTGVRSLTIQTGGILTVNSGVTLTITH